MDSELELSEVFRLEAAGEEDIVREVGDQLAARWLRVSRFREGASAHIAVVAGAVQPWHGVAGWSGAGSARFLQVFKCSGTSDRGCGLVGDGVFHAALLAAVGVTAALV